jgi:nicotinamide phosphoribosyltransferase
MNPLLLADYYKTEHHRMYPEGTTMIYSNWTPRKSRMKGIDKVIVFGIQYFCMKYLIDEFKTHFFDRKWEEVDEEYKFAVNVDTAHIKKLHELGYIPLEIKSLPEGSRCPIGVPVLTVKNTHPDFYWLTNYIETLMSTVLWQPMTSATIANAYRKLLTFWAEKTGGDVEFIDWQAHDFSARGLSSPESGMASGMAHLTSFTGTDTIAAIYGLKRYYKASGLIGASVPATEHSVMCMGTLEDEIGTFERLMKLYPTGILSVVSDTWDLWKVLTEYLPKLKDKILARDGKLVIRPDSGDPVDIICGNIASVRGEMVDKKWIPHPEYKGVVELLWDTFSGTINEKGYKQLDPHIGAIYGDSITLDRAEEICKRLEAKGFASTNVVFGIGSYTYQYNTRDTFGFAMKATYGEIITDKVNTKDASEPVVEGREIWKDPITDDGTKKSAKGLLAVHTGFDRMELKDQCTWKQEAEGWLETVFKDGKIVRETSLDEIRKRLK